MPNKQVTPTPFDNVEAGRKLRSRRLSMYGTLQEAEKVTGIFFQTISSLERGQMTNPSAELLTKVSKGFRIPISLLLAWYGYKPYEGQADQELR